jgi:CRISPR-associated protein Csx17
MEALVLGGVSPRSLGDLLKGYGVMAIVGGDCPDALFWWDDAFHLVIERPWDVGADPAKTRQAIENVVRGDLLAWGSAVAEAFKPTRQKSCDKPFPCPDHPQAKQKGNKKTCPVVIVESVKSPLKSPSRHDEFAPDVAQWARAAALLRTGDVVTHPLFAEASGDYFAQVAKAATAAERAPGDLILSWSLFMDGTPALSERLESGYGLFASPMKRYATGIIQWEREKDAAVSPWCFLLAVRGALALRGSLRRLRWGRRAYPAFPFVFEGSVVELGKGKFFRNVEMHLPTWNADRPRTLAEFETQMRQFQARLSGRGFAATAAEFRAAVVGRGAGAAFDTFHRFVLEGRRPGRQGQPMRQGIPRGTTRVGGKGEGHATLRLMLAPLAEKGWFDQFTGLPHRVKQRDDKENRLRKKRALVEDAINLAVDEPGLGSYRRVLQALWEVNRDILIPGAARQILEEAGRLPRPVPPLQARLWERALDDGLRTDPAHRLGRAIGSILGARAEGATVGPILEHMLPVRFRWSGHAWTVPESPPSRSLRWAGLDALGDFKALFWSRWLDGAELPGLPFAAARSASFDDIAALLRGDVNLREVHCLAGLYALLDWQSLGTGRAAPSGAGAPVPPSYAALRLWLELGINPRSDSRSPRDGSVARLLSLGSASQVERAAALALARLRVDGLPWSTHPRPTGRAVARFAATIPGDEAARMVLAVLIPISNDDTLALSRRLWVPIDEQETAA